MAVDPPELDQHLTEFDQSWSMLRSCLPTWAKNEPEAGATIGHDYGEPLAEIARTTVQFGQSSPNLGRIPTPRAA